MRRMARTGFVVVGLCVAISLVAGCGGASGSPEATDTVPTAAAQATLASTPSPEATAGAGTAASRTSAPGTTSVKTGTPTRENRPTPLLPSAGATTEPSAEPSELAPASPTASAPVNFELQEYDVPRGSHPHDVAPAEDGGVWYTAQAAGALGYLDPASGKTEHIPLGPGSAPHGVITGPDGAAWITDGGLNAIVRVDARTREVTRYDLPAGRQGANLNTAAFDTAGRLWFTGQSGVYGVLDPATGDMKVVDAPKGRGPYGITTTPDGKVYYASLAGSYLGQIDPETGEAAVLEPPTAAQGARRSWADSKGRVWISAWNTGQVAVYDPAAGSWQEWKLPGDSPRAYAVYVDWQDAVWLSDFGSNALVRFDPATQEFRSLPLPSASASVRQIHGRVGEVWAPESGADKLLVVRLR